MGTEIWKTILNNQGKHYAYKPIGMFSKKHKAKDKNSHGNLGLR